MRILDQQGNEITAYSMWQGRVVRETTEDGETVLRYTPHTPEELAAIGDKGCEPTLQARVERVEQTMDTMRASLHAMLTAFAGKEES